MKTYTAADCGCYVDGARGIYAVDAIVSFTNAHADAIGDPGINHECCPGECEYDGKSLSSCLFADELEAACEDWMEEHEPVEGCYWGRNENGDWGLWEIESEDN